MGKPQDEVTRGRKQGQVLFGSLKTSFEDREAVVACPRAGDPLKVITCLVLPTAGRNPKLGFEGGQTPLKKRAPRRGFHNP